MLCFERVDVLVAGATELRLPLVDGRHATDPRVGGDDADIDAGIGGELVGDCCRFVVRARPGAVRGKHHIVESTL